MKSTNKTLFFVSLMALITACDTGALTQTDGSVSSNTETNSQDILLDQDITVTFSAPVLVSTVTTTSFFIVPEPSTSLTVPSLTVAHRDLNAIDESVCTLANAISASVSCSTATSCTLTPDQDFEPETNYIICLTPDIQYENPTQAGIFEGTAFTFNTVEANTYLVGGTVAGLNGTVVLQNNSGDDLALTADGEFTFATPVADGADYVVTVLTNPDNPVHQTCTASHNSGTISGADVTNVSIVCSTNTFDVGGTVTGLNGTVVIQNNAGDNLSVSADGSFTFATHVADTAGYDVTVLTQPSGQTCTVTNGSDTVDGTHVTNVAVTCVIDDTTLSASVSTLALSVNDTGLNAALTGTPRLITITNTGADPATNVTYSPSPALPSGTTISPASCGTIAASDTCVLTITPGATPSAAEGDTNPTPIMLSISGENTNTLTPTVNVLTYGSVYQSGYVYAVDDTTPDTGSIGGKVAALTDQTAGVIWSSNGSSSVSYVVILGIDELSTTVSPSPTAPAYPFGTPAYVACNGKSDGACNTSNIVSYYNFNRAAGGSAPTPLVQYAAGLCEATISGESDWYLPAICEEGYDDIGSGANGCGTQASPTIQNMLSNLFDAGVGGLSGEYWSSTEWAGDAAVYAWSQTYDLGNIPQNTFDKSYSTIRVRCARAFVP